MRKLIRFVQGTAIGGVLWLFNVSPAFAVGLCPEDAGTTKFSTLCSTKWTAENVITTGINILLFVSFVAALAFLIIGGVRWIISGGDKEATAKAKGTVTSALIGLVIVLAAWILLNVVVTFFGLGSISNLQLPTLPK